MSIAEVMARTQRLVPPALPGLNRLESASRRILDRWPDVVPKTPDRDREALVQRMRAHVDAWNWTGMKLSLVTAAAGVVFDADFREREDLAQLRKFYIGEITASTLTGFLAAMTSVYISSYVPGSDHTRALANALRAVRGRIGGRWGPLLTRNAELLDPARAHLAVAGEMKEMEDVWAGLKGLGFAQPHAPGLMDHAHLAYVEAMRPSLAQREAIDRLLAWLKPEGQDARRSGAAEAVSAILEPWFAQDPDEDLKTHLVESLVGVYGDPRTQAGGIWPGISQQHKSVVFRWLTGENIRFFLDVVSAVESSHMWAPRRKFWLDLYNRKMITNAWVAFSDEAAARARIIRRGSVARPGLAFGIQEAGGSRRNTSLLILQIGNCIVIEGSHSYKVHLFRAQNPKAPKLFLPRYDCEKIRQLPEAEAVAHQGNWEMRVMWILNSLA